jgi:hypothetical protein
VEYAMPLPRLLAQVSDGRDPSLLVRARLGDQKNIDRDLGIAVRASGADYVSAYGLLCAKDDTACRTTVDDVPIQWDYGHLTAQGSRFLAGKLRESGALALSSGKIEGAVTGGQAQ